jgi:hypothetical protein
MTAQPRRRTVLFVVRNLQTGGMERVIDTADDLERVLALCQRLSGIRAPMSEVVSAAG